MNPHRYTCVPHPEPSSLLPPHTIPLVTLNLRKCIFLSKTVYWKFSKNNQAIYLNIKK